MAERSLREPIFLAPMTLTLEELRALHLGAELVRQTSDGELATAADRLLAKVSAVLPSGTRSSKPIQDLAAYASLAAAPSKHLGLLRHAVAARLVLAVSYRRLDVTRTVRRIYPFQTECWGRLWTCLAWCELRGGFRVFRVDRIDSCQETGDTFTPTWADLRDDLATHGARPEPIVISRGPGGLHRPPSYTSTAASVKQLRPARETSHTSRPA